MHMTMLEINFVLASTWRPAWNGVLPRIFLAGAAGDVLPVNGQESREKNEVINSGN